MTNRDFAYFIAGHVLGCVTAVFWNTEGPVSLRLFTATVYMISFACAWSILLGFFWLGEVVWGNTRKTAK